MKLLLPQLKTVILQSILCGLCLFTNSTFCIGSPDNQGNERQAQLMRIFNSTESFVSLDSSHWQRITEHRTNGDVVVLTPEHDAVHRGNFIVNIKEIHRGPTCFIEKNFYQPSEPVAFVLGSALVCAAVYWFLQTRTHLLENN